MTILSPSSFPHTPARFGGTQERRRPTRAKSPENAASVHSMTWSAG